MNDSKKLKVLLVDDDTNLGEATADILGDLGYHCTVCQNGLEGLEEVKENTYDVVISDIKMPEMNGVEMVREIKKVNTDLPIIIMTAFRGEDLIQEALDEGVYECVHKPLDVDHLLKLIQQIEENRDVQ